MIHYVNTAVHIALVSKQGLRKEGENKLNKHFRRSAYFHFRSFEAGLSFERNNQKLRTMTILLRESCLNNNNNNNSTSSTTTNNNNDNKQHFQTVVPMYKYHSIKKSPKAEIFTARQSSKAIITPELFSALPIV